MTEVAGRFTPLRGKVLLAPLPEKEVVRGGIVIPAVELDTGESRQRSFHRCEVVAVGPECELRPGQQVYIERFARGDSGIFELNGRKVFAIHERHLNMTIEG